MNDFEEENLKPGQISILRLFGPSIAHVKIPEDLIEKLNNYTDKVIEDEKKSLDLDPLNNPHAAVVHRATENSIKAVMIGGEFVHGKI